LKTTGKIRRSAEQFVAGIAAGDRVVLSQAITLIESSLPADQQLAGDVLEKILPVSGKALRIGITGVPGVGKSTFIEAFGEYVVAQGKKLAVLTIDPTSQLSKGSILGDKTRMETLSRNPNAFIRPSASGNALGGVAHKTREAMLLCEAAGFDVILIETVGVGQSEVAVKNMVDFFLLLMLAGAGDELQGIKKGIMEMADGLVITKADGDNIQHATSAQAEYQHALHLFAPPSSGWYPQVLVSSAKDRTGLEAIWQMVLTFEEKTKASGFFDTTRRQQNIAWFQSCFQELLQEDIQKTLNTENLRLEQAITGHTLSSRQAAYKLLAAYHNAIRMK
jgi:LAO/AO transport system kinase